MQLAIDEAWRGVRSGNGEVGVVVARGGDVVFSKMAVDGGVLGARCLELYRRDAA